MERATRAFRHHRQTYLRVICTIFDWFWDTTETETQKRKMWWESIPGWRVGPYWPTTEGTVFWQCCCVVFKFLLHSFYTPPWFCLLNLRWQLQNMLSAPKSSPSLNLSLNPNEHKISEDKLIISPVPQMYHSSVNTEIGKTGPKRIPSKRLLIL